MNITVYRKITQVLFILLIFLMPVLDILRYDAATKELIVFGQAWSLGLKEGFYADPSASGAFHIAVRFFLKAILPWLFYPCNIPFARLSHRQVVLRMALP